MMNNNKWGRYVWSAQFQSDKVHPDDLEEFNMVYVPFVIFECIGAENKYIKLKFGDSIFRVDKENFKELPTPKFKVSERVAIGQNISATIVLNEWRLDNRERYYYVRIDGKKKPKRVLEKDIQRV
ncbi:MAG: hypothetical protein LBO72_00265 [Helicobacteraceae bacterium]|jgi:hypothetical protein|nr:hypothetical protein [Helicobacteraceae bacterium]